VPKPPPLTAGFRWRDSIRGRLTMVVALFFAVMIDEIAFQTDLLALKAGVEAASAGQAGKGFAVVASEAPALAQRSADAAKEIKTLISASAAQVENGVRLVTETGAGLERIIARAAEINRVVADIAGGAQEQALGLQEVNGAIHAMDQTTRQNATMAEESNAASHSLAQETSRLAERISDFNLGGGREAQLRRELQKAAPHAFAKATSRAPQAAAKRPAPQKPALARAANDWAEF
jgi:methyl-accepting chemotaxis protein